MGTRSDEKYTLLTDYAIHSAYSEAYRTLYANICLDWQTDHAQAAQSQLQPVQCHTLLLTTPSASTYADYATVAANLAIVAAQSGTPTVLVDADLRTPHLQQRFGLAKSTGLSELLMEESVTPQQVALCLQATFVPGLQLLCAGASTDQAATLMLSPKLDDAISSIRRHLEETATKTSVVIVHSPPVLSGADASLIGALMEQTFLAIATGRTTRTQVKQAQEQLERAHAKLAGIITLDV